MKPSVNLVKAKDGTWNFEGLGPKPEPGAKPAPEPSKPGPAAQKPAAGVPGNTARSIIGLVCDVSTSV